MPISAMQRLYPKRRYRCLLGTLPRTEIHFLIWAVLLAALAEISKDTPMSYMFADDQFVRSGRRSEASRARMQHDCKQQIE